MKTDRPAGGPAGHESIAMLLTAPQPAAIAVIRLDGPAVVEFIARHLSKPLRIGQCVHCDLHDGEETIDDIVAVQISDSRVDLNVHGGEWVIKSTLQLAERGGFCVTQWREAPAIATGAIDELKAEVAAALPFAATREALAILLAQPAAWATLLASPSHDAIVLAIEDRIMQYILTPPNIAIVGAPNAGKSTLVNRLAGQARSIVADMPGTTRDYVTTPANLAGVIVNLIDTPGWRETNDPIEAAAIDRSVPVVKKADLVIELRDTMKTAAPVPGLGDPLIVWNKCDRRPPPSKGLGISAETGLGLDALRGEIFSRLAIGNLKSLHARCWTARQRAILKSHPSPSGGG